MNSGSYRIDHIVLRGQPIFMKTDTVMGNKKTDTNILQSLLLVTSVPYASSIRNTKVMVFH